MTDTYLYSNMFHCCNCYISNSTSLLLVDIQPFSRAYFWPFSNFNCMSPGGIDEGMLYDSIFEIADMWTDDVEPEHYANFLLLLHHRVTRLNKDPGFNTKVAGRRGSLQNKR